MSDVLIMGGGFAGLSAATALAAAGHGVTVLEKRPVLGGLNTTGVAPYKMKADRSVEELEWILQIGGIDIKTNTEITVDQIPELEKKHQALFLGVGLGIDTPMKVPGEDLANVHGAVD